MNHEDVIAAESERFASVLATAHPRAQCPTCPEWNAADLLWHLTGVQHFWANVLSQDVRTEDRKSTRLNSSHVAISYAVFCLKKKTNEETKTTHYDQHTQLRSKA